MAEQPGTTFSRFRARSSRRHHRAPARTRQRPTPLKLELRTWQLEGVEASRIAGLVFGNRRGSVPWLVAWLRPDGRFAPGCVGVTERMYRRIGLIGQVDD